MINNCFAHAIKIWVSSWPSFGFGIGSYRFELELSCLEFYILQKLNECCWGSSEFLKTCVVKDGLVGVNQMGWLWKTCIVISTCHKDGYRIQILEPSMWVHSLSADLDKQLVWPPTFCEALGRKFLAYVEGTLYSWEENIIGGRVSHFYDTLWIWLLKNNL
jgi:hypothetical protein